MATALLAEPAPRAREHAPAGRLLSLDAYRGLIMFILVSNGLGMSALAAYPQWKWLADQFEHSAVDGHYLLGSHPAGLHVHGRRGHAVRARAAQAGRRHVRRPVQARLLARADADRAQQPVLELRRGPSSAAVDQRVVADRVRLRDLLPHPAVAAGMAGGVGRAAACRPVGTVRDVPGTAGRILTSRQHRPDHRSRRPRVHLPGLLRHHQLHRQRGRHPVRLLDGAAAARTPAAGVHAEGAGRGHCRRVPDRPGAVTLQPRGQAPVDGVVQLPRRGVGDRRDGRALLGDRRARLEALDVPLRRARDELDLRLRVLAAARRMAGSRSRDVHEALRISRRGRRDPAPARRRSA